MSNLIDFILLILGILSIILFCAIGYYLGNAMYFWSWDYTTWKDTNSQNGFTIRLILLLILMYLVLK